MSIASLPRWLPRRDLSWTWEHWTANDVATRNTAACTTGKARPLIASTTSRPIAAGLREGSITTWAKVTGTLPRLIDLDGQDVPIVGRGPPSINEQRTLIAAASAAGEALVHKCMALKPEYQRIAEDGLVRASIGVITNVRPEWHA